MQSISDPQNIWSKNRTEGRNNSVKTVEDAIAPFLIMNRTSRWSLIRKNIIISVQQWELIEITWKNLPTVNRIHVFLMNIRPYIRKDHDRLQIIPIKDKNLLHKISFLTKTRLSQKSGIEEKLENLQNCLKQTYKQTNKQNNGSQEIWKYWGKNANTHQNLWMGQSHAKGEFCSYKCLYKKTRIILIQ